MRQNDSDACIFSKRPWIQYSVFHVYNGVNMCSYLINQSGQPCTCMITDKHMHETQEGVGGVTQGIRCYPL